MDENAKGLPAAVRAGDEVILSTGAVARATGDYEAGYSGLVALALDGQEMSERAESITLHASGAPNTGSQDSPSPEASPAGEENDGIRESSKRMRD